MAITPNGTTLTKDAAAVVCVRDITFPEESVKEIDITCLSDAIETFTAGTLKTAAEMVFVIVKDPEVNAYDEGDSGTFVVTFPKQTSGSTSGETLTFDGFIRSKSTSNAGSADDAAFEETITVRLTTIVTRADEA